MSDSMRMFQGKHRLARRIRLTNRVRQCQRFVHADSLQSTSLHHPLVGPGSDPAATGKSMCQSLLRRLADRVRQCQGSDHAESGAHCDPLGSRTGSSISPSRFFRFPVERRRSATPACFWHPSLPQQAKCQKCASGAQVLAGSVCSTFPCCTGECFAQSTSFRHYILGFGFDLDAAGKSIRYFCRSQLANRVRQCQGFGKAVLLRFPRSAPQMECR